MYYYVLYSLYNVDFSKRLGSKSATNRLGAAKNESLSTGPWERLHEHLEAQRDAEVGEPVHEPAKANA